MDGTGEVDVTEHGPDPIGRLIPLRPSTRAGSNAGDGRPPLRLALDVPLLAAGAAAVAALAALAVAVTTRVAFRARSAGRFREAGA